MIRFSLTYFSLVFVYHTDKVKLQIKTDFYQE